MLKRVILCLVVLCLLLILPCSGQAEVKEKDTLEALYSASEAFINEHYGVTIEQAEEYARLETEIRTARPTLIPSKNLYSLEEYAPDLAERFYALFRKKYQVQPMTEKALEITIRNGIPVMFWRLVLSEGSDIKITQVELSLVNTAFHKERNGINYTVGLLINETAYEVNGVLGLEYVDGRWRIYMIKEYGWSPYYPQIKH